jgi:AcrR family transcriptional regulator
MDDEIMAMVSVHLDRAAVKNIHQQHVRNGTSGQDRPETADRRVQRTRSSLHNALMGLAREKPYPSIAVKEILHRANVGRSTFYTHFRDKDDLLESGIHEILRSLTQQAQQRCRSATAARLPCAAPTPIVRPAAGPREGAERVGPSSILPGWRQEPAAGRFRAPPQCNVRATTEQRRYRRGVAPEPIG